jgi:hypothetical protein
MDDMDSEVEEEAEGTLEENRVSMKTSMFFTSRRIFEEEEEEEEKMGGTTEEGFLSHGKPACMAYINKQKERGKKLKIDHGDQTEIQCILSDLHGYGLRGKALSRRVCVLRVKRSLGQSKSNVTGFFDSKREDMHDMTHTATYLCIHASQW